MGKAHEQNVRATTTFVIPSSDSAAGTTPTLPLRQRQGAIAIGTFSIVEIVGGTNTAMTDVMMLLPLVIFRSP